MAQVTVYALGGATKAVYTTYSGLVTSSSGSAVVDVRDVATMQREGWSLGAGANNLAATVDPTTTNDSSQGYGPGSIWINATYPRVWLCNSAAIGAAAWVLLYQLA